MLEIKSRHLTWGGPIGMYETFFCFQKMNIIQKDNNIVLI